MGIYNIHNVDKKKLDTIVNRIKQSTLSTGLIEEYYDMEIPRRGLSIIAPNIVLWAYRIGSAVKSKHGQEPDYKALAEGQLFPARIFYPDGRAIYNVSKDIFNDSDLKYI